MNYELIQILSDLSQSHYPEPLHVMEYVDKTCSCKEHYLYWDRDECKENNLGLWFTCYYCGSTMLKPNKFQEERLKAYKLAKQTKGIS